MRKLTFTNDIFTSERKHYVTLYVECDLAEGEPEVREPHKCERWRWMKRDSEFSGSLFLPIVNLIREGFDFWEP